MDQVNCIHLEGVTREALLILPGRSTGYHKSWVTLVSVRGNYGPLHQRINVTSTVFGDDVFRSIIISPEQTVVIIT